MKCTVTSAYRQVYKLLKIRMLNDIDSDKYSANNCSKSCRALFEQIAFTLFDFFYYYPFLNVQKPFQNLEQF